MLTAKGQHSTGNTPTCVGKTPSPAAMQWLAEKHPHVCGEDIIGHDCDRYLWETPPRVWGRLTAETPFHKWNRNTPTCVGKTTSA